METPLRAKRKMAMANGVTGLSGKNWIKELSTQRVGFLVQELKNGGRGLTFEELKNMTAKKLPGGPIVGDKFVKKVVYGLDNGRDLKTMDDVREVLLPTGGGARTWERKREEARLAFLKKTHGSAEGVKKCKRGHDRTPDNIYKNGACRLCNSGPVLRQLRLRKEKRMAKKKTVAEARMESFEVLPENIRMKMVVAPGAVAESVLLQVDKLKKLMELQQYSRIEIILPGEGQPAVISILPAATPIVVHR